MKLIKFPSNFDLAESFQACEVKFSFVNKTEDGFKMLFPWVKCREYFNEFLMVNHHPESFEFVETYGFKYNHESYPYDLSSTNIAMKFPTSESKTAFEKNFNFLNTIEEFNGLQSSSYVDIDKDIVVVSGDPSWVTSCILTNIYTLLLKLISLPVDIYSSNDILNYKYKETIPTEISYIKQIKLPNFNRILNSINKLLKINTKYVDGTNKLSTDKYDIHGSRGIIAWSCGYMSTTMKNLYAKIMSITEYKQFISETS